MGPGMSQWRLSSASLLETILEGYTRSLPLSSLELGDFLYFEMLKLLSLWIDVEKEEGIAANLNNLLSFMQIIPAKITASCGEVFSLLKWVAVSSTLPILKKVLLLVNSRSLQTPSDRENLHWNFDGILEIAVDFFSIIVGARNILFQ